MPISGIRTPYDEKNSLFKVVFIPQKAVSELFVRLRIGSDDEDKRIAEVKFAKMGEHSLEMYKEFIKISQVEKGKKIILHVALHNAKRCPLEVTAYVK